MVVTVLKEFDPPEINMTYAEAIKELRGTLGLFCESPRKQKLR